VAYTPDWEPLADALNRVMAAGAEEDEAKTDLCGAVANRKIDVRVRVAASDRSFGGRVFSDGNVGVPSHLRPGDLDWARSRPLVQWQIGPIGAQNYTWISGWEDRPLDLIELSTADVIEVLCGGGSEKVASLTAGQETARALAIQLKSNPQMSRAEAKAWCKKSGYNVSGSGFQSRVWPNSRAQAGLPVQAPPGRKKKS
jgi:hypothetical protein